MLGLSFIPVFFVVFQTLQEKVSRKKIVEVIPGSETLNPGLL
jgi:hypothetical protein